jgi:hypothetical protein
MIDRTAGPRRSRLAVVALVMLVLVLVTSPITLLQFAFWATDGNWEFTGGGFRHWLLVKGSTVDRLGFVTVVAEPARYVVRLGEGNDPGEVAAEYDSGAAPEVVVGVYAERCRTLGIPVKKRTVAPDAAEARLVCEGVAYSDDVFLTAKRAAGASTTQVRIFAGPGLTGTYNF